MLSVYSTPTNRNVALLACFARGYQRQRMSKVNGIKRWNKPPPNVIQCNIERTTQQRTTPRWMDLFLTTYVIAATRTDVASVHSHRVFAVRKRSGYRLSLRRILPDDEVTQMTVSPHLTSPHQTKQHNVTASIQSPVHNIFHVHHASKITHRTITGFDSSKSPHGFSSPKPRA